MLQHTQHNRYMNDAAINCEKLRQQLRKESQMLREESMNVLHEFEALELLRLN